MPTSMFDWFPAFVFVIVLVFVVVFVFFFVQYLLRNGKKYQRGHQNMPTCPFDWFTAFNNSFTAGLSQTQR